MGTKKETGIEVLNVDIKAELERLREIWWRWAGLVETRMLEVKDLISISQEALWLMNKDHEMEKSLSEVSNECENAKELIRTIKGVAEACLDTTRVGWVRGVVDSSRILDLIKGKSF